MSARRQPHGNIRSDSGSLRGCRILVVEDQYLVAAEMRRLIERLGGVTIGPCKSAADAQSLIETEAVDLALLDVNLDGTSVYGIADRLLARGTPIIFATGYEAWAIDHRYAGTPHLEKPVIETALVEAIRALGVVRVGSGS